MRLSISCLILGLVAVATAAARPKIIIDNDWNAGAYVTFLLAIDAGYEVLGLVGDTANSWSRQTSLHALALLEIGNLSCIPVHKGTDYPLLNNEGLWETWKLLHGPLPYEGVFQQYNETAEATGRDPSSGDPKRLALPAFIEGFPNTTLASEDAAAWMVEQVRKYPGEVLIYSGGAFTNIALATRMDSSFASSTRGLVAMGGYIDVMLYQTSGSKTLADINSDINLKIDPEASKIALTADFPSITLVGNGANQVFPDQAYIDDVATAKTPYINLFQKYYGTELPFWDELAMFAAIYPNHVTNSTSFYVDVDTAWSSPYYGNIMAY
ncbi:inosine-uridine preferring nucleoside hydrolase [Stachybotrys elegans]|uniref:Inosine-uridine preferring nucleoside hydrolase n=1 Tax=Stachybotrys elegans TaxID=80388 RepID=A0A8K0SFU8_9HYPO|nr:inosine-uridine preferring nucleoside hydrolase [Stachybotrys elegans]